LRKNPEIFFRKNRQDLNKYILIQKKLLNKSVKLSRKNSLIIYMVCSFLEEETTKQIDNFLKFNKNFEIEKFKTSDYKKLVDSFGYINIFPTTINNKVKIDGFFAAKIKRYD
jgi:16S rRNA C967 or C1407 C5-methylase (RsmB/RsmF family)